MSIELNWETLTGGPDGAELAERIRDFIHTKFQGVPLPRFIKSVTVHEFAFGSIPPEVALKDICDPLPDFYEDDGDLDDDEEDEEQGGGHGGGDHTGGGDYGERHRQSGPDSAAHALGRMDLDGGDQVPDAIRMAERRRLDEQRRRFAGGGGGGGGRADSPAGGSRGFGGHNNSSSRQEAGEFPFPPHIRTTGLRSAPATPADIGTPTFVGLGASTPGIPGGTSNMHFFQSKLAAATAAGGWSGVGGSQTPLAAVAGAQHLNGWLADNHDRHHQYPSSAGSSPRRRGRRRSSQSQAGGGGFPPPAQGHRGGSGGGGGHERNPSQSSISVTDFAAATGAASLAPPPPLREKHSVSTLAPTSAGAPSRPPTRDMAGLGAAASAIDEEDDYGEDEGNGSDRGAGGGKGKGGEDDDDDEPPRKYREPRPEDMQTVFRIRYAGDVRLMLTAEILLDYPMPSFVGIPVKLNITGLTFDGVGVLAYIRKRVHFCFLSPEDALAAVGESEDEDEEQPGQQQHQKQQQQQQQQQQGHGHAAAPGASGGNDGGPGKKEKGRLGGLLQEIRVESEIGQREGSKQSLKNVGKVERFVLEQVRRIFEEEFVYPSFWTFLV